jgi:WD40 repeat protein
MSTMVTPAPPSPYKGLAAFDDTDLDALLFFGRSWETEVVASNVLASRLTVLYGPSGVGKSSLLRAGVVRALREEGGSSPSAVAVYASWSGDPLVGLEEAARAAVADALGREPADAPGGLTDRLAAWSAELGAELCLMLDQLEELFLYHPGSEGAGGFVDLLPELVTRPGLHVNVLLGIRDDALAQLDVLKGRIPGLFANSLRLDHLDREAARAAILGPIERYNALAAAGAAVVIEPQLVETVLDEVAQGRIDLGGHGSAETVGNADRVETPYLQLVLQRVWEVERERGSTTLRLETFRGLGGAQRIVEDHLERALRALTPGQQDAAASMFGHLVTPSGTKIAHGVSDLATYAAVPEQEIDPVLRALASQRILRPLGENGHAGGRYEIFHDVLAGAVLAWRTRHDAEAALVREREAARRRHRRLLALALAALFGLTVMTALAAYALSQRNEAQQQAALARSQAELAEQGEAEAKKQKRAAERAEAEAHQQAKNAQEAQLAAAAAAQKANQASRDALEQKQLADAAAKRARAATDVALREKARAEDSAAYAQTQQGIAEGATQRAVDQARRATAAQKLADRRTDQAVAAQKRAVDAQRRADGQRLLAQSLAALATNPERGVRLAVEASRLISGPAVEDAVRSALLAMRVRHVLRAAGAVTAARFDADGSRVATADRAGEARVFRASDAEPIGRFRAGSPLNDVALSPDGRFVAAAAADGRVPIWNVESGQPVRTLTHGGSVGGVSWSPNGRLVATAGARAPGSVQIWDAATGDRLHQLDHPGPLRSITFSPDGSLLATVTELDRFVRVFDARAGTQISKLEHPGDATSAAFSPGSDRIVTGSRDRFARLWEARSGNETLRFPVPTGQITDVAFDAGGTRVATASTDDLARIWDAESGAVEDVFRGHQGAITGLAFAPDGQSLVTSSTDRTARLWPSGGLPVSLLGHTSDVVSTAFAPNGRFVLTASADGTARLWTATADPPLRPLITRPAAIDSVAFNGDGSRLANAGADGVVSVTRPDGAPIWALQLARQVETVAWSANDRLLAAARNGLIRVWTRDGDFVGELRHRGVLRAAAISPDGRLAATGGDNRTVQISEVESGEPVQVIPHAVRVTAVAYSPDGKLLATAAGKRLSLWNTRTWEGVTQLEAHADTITGIAFSPDGVRMATSSEDHNAVLWDVRRRRAIKPFIGHSAGINGLAFSRDGRWLVTAGAAAAGVWQVRSGDLPRSFLFFLRGHRRPLTSVAFSPRDWRIATASADGTIRTYSCALCGGTRTLVRIGKARLAALAAEKRAQR